MDATFPPPPPPPPPPALAVPSEQADQLNLFNVLKELGYQAEHVSPWRLVTELVEDVVKRKEEAERVRVALQQVVDFERRRADRAEQEKLAMLKEVASKIKELQEDKERVQDALFERGDVNSRQLAEMMAKNKRLESEIARLRLALSECQQECQRLASVASFASNTKENVSNELQQQQQVSAETDRTIELLRKQLEDERSSRAQLLEELDAVRVDMARIEGSKDALVSKCERIQQSLKECEDAKTKLNQSIIQSREETRVVSDMIAEERRNRKAIKARLDEVEKELVSTKQELAKQEKRATSAEKLKLDLESHNSTLKRQIAGQSEALSGRDDELRQVTIEKEGVEQQLEDERKQHSLRLHELRAAALDVSNMARENRDLTHAIERIQRDLRDTKSALEESRSKTQRFAGMLDAAKLERAELLTVYKKVCDENARLSNDVKDLSSTRIELLNEERQASDSAAELSRRNTELEVQLKRQQVDLENYDRRVEGLSRELRACRLKCEALEEGKTLAERASGSEQQRHFEAARQHEQLRWELDQTKAEFASCTARLQKALDENAKLAEQLVAERLRIGEMEAQVERARIGQAKALISSGKAFTTTTTERILGSPPPEHTPKPRTPAGNTPRHSDEDSSSVSTMKDFDERQYEDLERVMGDDLSEASSVIRQSRNARTQTPGFTTSAHTQPRPGSRGSFRG